MFKPEEIQRMSAILSHCSPDQVALIRNVDQLIQNENNENRIQVLYSLKKSLLYSWGDIQKNNESFAALPMLSKIINRQGRSITPGASLSQVSSFAGCGRYDFFLVENSVDRKRRIIARKATPIAKDNVNELVQRVPVCFSEYAAYLSEYSVDSENEFLTILAVLENQWTVSA